MHVNRTVGVANYTVIVALGLTLSSAANALRVESSASVTPGITVTDNVCLTENNKKWDWVGVATPRASVKVKGKKSDLTLTSSVQLNTLTDSQLEDNGCTGLGQREKFSPRFNANAKTELIPGWLNLGVRGRIDQQEANFGRAGGNDDLDRRGNRNNYYRYSINPTLSHRIGPYANGTLRYSYDQKFNSVNTIADTTRQTVTMSIDDNFSSRLNTGLRGSYTRLESEDTSDGRRGRTSELASALVSAGYQFNPRLQANGSWGWDFNDFVSNRRSRNDQRGARWDAGLRWTPSPRTRVSLGTGNRYFGNTPRLGIEHKRRQSTFSLDYSTRITFEREIRDLQRGFLDGFAGSSSIRGDSPIIDERVTVGYNYAGRNANINLSGSWSEQEREDDGAVSVFKNIGLTYSPVLSRRYTLSATVTWDEDEPRQPIGVPDIFGDQPTSETWRGIITVGKQLNNRFNLSVNYAYTDRQSDTGFGNYQENRITAFLGISL